MKRLLTYLALCFVTVVFSQENKEINTNNADFSLGEGLQLNFEDNKYQFKISGFVQPGYTYSKIKNRNSEHQFNVQGAYFNISGTAWDEKVSFFVQTDFSLKDPLLDAWVAYHPTSAITIAIGQKRTFTNNREMTIDEDKFQFVNRSLLSREFSRTGREFGLFVDGKFSFGNFGFHPQAAISSGDGRNSFGNDSRDTDAGGLKYGGRLDLYPLGYFSENNDRTTADLRHEEKPKFVVGGAASYNDGASNAVGEGHKEFFLYKNDGKPQLPDYRKVYADILVKYKGFSVLGEYVNATATGLEETFVNEAGNVALSPTEIASYLVLGNAQNYQLGYATLSGYALDIRYSKMTPEFETNKSSILKDVEAYTLGLSKYFKDNNLKIQAAFSSLHYKDNENEFNAALIMQIVF